MVLAYDVRRNDELPVGMLVEVAYEDVLVRTPRRACNKHLAVASESLYNRKLLGSVAYLQHAVESGVAHNLGCVYANVVQQLSALLVLYEELGNAM